MRIGYFQYVENLFNEIKTNVGPRLHIGGSMAIPLLVSATNIYHSL